jgi:hypothetical protein
MRKNVQNLSLSKNRFWFSVIEIILEAGQNLKRIIFLIKDFFEDNLNG